MSLPSIKSESKDIKYWHQLFPRNISLRTWVNWSFRSPSLPRHRFRLWSFQSTAVNSATETLQCVHVLTHARHVSEKKMNNNEQYPSYPLINMPGQIKRWKQVRDGSHFSIFSMLANPSCAGWRQSTRGVQRWTTEDDIKTIWRRNGLGC